MPCLLALVVLAFPRLAIVLLWLLTNFFDRAYSLIVLILGFIFLPLTTIVYAWIFNQGQPIAGVNLVAIIIAVIVDLGLLGGSHPRWRRN